MLFSTIHHHLFFIGVSRSTDEFTNSDMNALLQESSTVVKGVLSGFDHPGPPNQHSLTGIFK
jgi:hypothetical protein